jgi:hypothetical protein
MHVYAQLIAKLPRRWAIPVTQLGCVGLLVAFWGLFSAGSEAASVGFYVFGLIFGLLLISQFWTLAIDIYDARHAKRLFGFIGGGASLGGATGAAITAGVVNRVGTVNLLLVSAVVMALCVLLVVLIVRREATAGTSLAEVEARGTGGAEAIRLLRESRHLQTIAVIIGCAAIGGVIIEQQRTLDPGLHEVRSDGEGGGVHGRLPAALTSGNPSTRRAMITSLRLPPAGHGSDHPPHWLTLRPAHGSAPCGGPGLAGLSGKG